MELKKLTNRVYYYPHNPDTDRPLLGYISGSNYSLMIDAGNSHLHVEEFNTAVKVCGFKEPSFVAITHWHWDHTFGMHSVKGITIANYRTNEILNKMKREMMEDAQMSQRLMQDDNHMLKEYSKDKVGEIKIVTADISFDQSIELNLGNLVVNLFLVESPHSKDSVFIYIPEEKVLFMGDATSEDYYNNSYLDKEKLKHLVQTLESIECNYCLLSHADPLKKQELLDYLYTVL
jgi:glyoxylase-like metal-dependent hydrolase (beta-lactamase superfamily II)